MRLGYLLLLASLGAAAQTVERDARDLGREGVLSAQDFAETARRGVDYKYLQGLAYTDAESGEERWVTPFEFRVRFNERRTYLKVSGDGYVDSRSEEGHATGLANVNVALTHHLGLGWRGTLGVTLPTGGEVGSERGRERVGVSYERDLGGEWSGLVKAQLVRYDADPDPGDSRVRRQLLLQASRTFDADAFAFAQLERLYRPGVSESTVASLGYQMPVGEAAGGPLVAVLTYSRGLTSGQRDNTIELDFCLRF